jgi:hypothetical protein
MSKNIVGAVDHRLLPIIGSHRHARYIITLASRPLFVRRTKNRPIPKKLKITQTAIHHHLTINLTPQNAQIQ